MAAGKQNHHQNFFFNHQSIEFKTARRFPYLQHILNRPFIIQKQVTEQLIVVFFFFKTVSRKRQQHWILGKFQIENHPAANTYQL